MNFAVTGGAGFIGSHLVGHLVSKGHDVTVLDDLSRGQIANLDWVRDKINFVKLDIIDYEKLKKNLENTDGIFHQAALTSVPESYEREDEYKKVNVTGTENIFKIAQEFNIKVVYASSSSVYGNTTSIPIAEDSNRRPINPYGLTKLEVEYMAEKFSQQNTNIIGLRYFNIYGMNQNPNYAGVITKFLNALNNGESPVIFGDGSQIRDFVFVQDVARANLVAMESKIKHGFFNIGTGKPTSILELVHLMIRIFKRSPKLVHKNFPLGDVKLSTADVSQSTKLLGWKSETILEDGLQTLFYSGKHKFVS